jgi:hypothetical protein
MVLKQPTSKRWFYAFGFTLCSNEDFSPWLEETKQLPESLYIRKTDQPLFTFSSKSHVFNNPILIAGEPVIQVYHADDIWGMRLARIGDFFFTAQEILFIPHMSDYFPTLQVAVLSNVLAFWMELRGLRTLHGAALTWRERSFALLAESTTGKSTLAASLLQNGASLLSDDITVVEAYETGFRLRPGYASMRLGFKQVEYFLGSNVGLVRTLPRLDKAIVPIGARGWARLEKNNQPLDQLYVLERRLANGLETPKILYLKPAEAVMALVRHSFVHHMPFLTGTAPQRLDFLHQLTSQVQVKRLVYPGGYENLQAVCKVIQRDLGV